MNRWSLDSPSGHIVCVMLIFATGVALYVSGRDYGKEIMAGALGSLWTLLQIRKPAELVHQAEVVNQTISESTTPERKE